MNSAVEVRTLERPWELGLLCPQLSEGPLQMAQPLSRGNGSHRNGDWHLDDARGKVQ